VPEHLRADSPVNVEIQVLGVFDHIEELYRWIDSWCNPDEMIPGAAAHYPPNLAVLPSQQFWLPAPLL
jgi:hypothetical protein